MKYDVDYFIGKFYKIPDDKWLTDAYHDSEGRKCAAAMCSFIPVKAGEPCERVSLDRLFRLNLGLSTTRINDASGYLSATIDEILLLGSTPKERIISALELIKAGVSV